MSWHTGWVSLSVTSLLLASVWVFHCIGSLETCMHSMLFHSCFWSWKLWKPPAHAGQGRPMSFDHLCTHCNQVCRCCNRILGLVCLDVKLRAQRPSPSPQLPFGGPLLVIPKPSGATLRVPRSYVRAACDLEVMRCYSTPPGYASLIAVHWTICQVIGCSRLSFLKKSILLYLGYLDVWVWSASTSESEVWLTCWII